MKLNLGKIKFIDSSIRRRFYNLGPKRDLRPLFDELAKGLKPEKINEVNPSSIDEAGVLRAYTERRGIMATLKYERETNRDALDLSYDFVGYDVESKPYLIEVKAFRDAINKNIQLTKNEYETMNREENYKIYIIEDAWSDFPKLNIIEDPKNLPFTKQIQDFFETKKSTEEYFECFEDRWRSHIRIETILKFEEN